MKMRCEDAHRIQLALRFGHCLLSTQHFDTVVARVRACTVVWMLAEDLLD